MRIHRHFRQTRAKVFIVVIFCLVATALPLTASGEPISGGTSSCGSTGNATDSAGSPTPPGPTDDIPVSTNGAVGQIADYSSYDDSALKILDEHTELLSQSDSADPAFVEGKLESDCGVAFILDGTQKQVGAVGVTGLQISEGSRWLVQGLEGSRGYRMMAVLEDARAPKSYTVKLELDQNISVVSLDNGGAVFVNENNLVIGSILAPWALDANGQSVPITQTVSKTSIIITVDTSSVTSWPVVADPTYHTFRCYSQHQVTTTGTASQYLNGHKCPRYADIIARGYYPQWIEHFNRWRVGKANGDCSAGVSERDESIFGVIYDFNQACKGHDYCYDLGHSDRLNYENVTKVNCDSIMLDDMNYDCSNRSFPQSRICETTAQAIYAVVSLCPNWVCY